MARTLRASLPCFAAICLLCACSSNPEPSSDGGATPPNDAGTTDAGAGADAGSHDAGNPGSDAGTGDSGTITGTDAGSGTDAGGGIFTHAFDGESGLSPPAQYRGKPEMNVAANGTQLAQVTWRAVNVYDYSGNLLQTMPLPGFVADAGLNPTTSTGGGPYEAHILYDPFIQRWIVTTSCLYDCVIVSSGSDVMASTWQGFYLDNDGNDPSVHVAYDANGVYFSEVSGPASVDTPCCGSSVFAIPNSDLQWTTSLNPTHRNKMTGKPLETMPVLDDTPGKASNAPEFFMARTCPSGNSCQGNATSPIVNDAFEWIVSSGTWSGTTFNWTSNHTALCTGGASPSDQCLRTDPNGTSNEWLYNTPIDPPQLGSTDLLRGAEIHRILDAVQQGTEVHVVMGSGPCVSASACADAGTDQGNIALWADFDCSTPGACTVHQTQKLSTPEHLLWPSVGVDYQGNVGIVANHVSTSTYLGIEAWTHRTTDALGMLNGPLSVIAGSTSYTCSSNGTTAQTGNPVGVTTTRDPLDPGALWVSQQYARDSADCQWNTRILQYKP